MIDEWLSIQLKKAEKWEAVIEGMSILQWIPIETIPKFLSDIVEEYNKWGDEIYDYEDKISKIREILEETQYMDEAVILKYKLLKVINNE